MIPASQKIRRVPSSGFIQYINMSQTTWTTPSLLRKVHPSTMVLLIFLLGGFSLWPQYSLRPWLRVSEPTSATTGHHAERLTEFQRYTVLTPPVAVRLNVEDKDESHLETTKTNDSDGKSPRYSSEKDDLLQYGAPHHRLQERIDLMENRLQEQIMQIEKSLQQNLVHINMDHNEKSVPNVNGESGKRDDETMKTELVNPDIEDVNKENNRDLSVNILRELDRETDIKPDADFKHESDGEYDKEVHNLGVKAPPPVINMEWHNRQSKFEVMAAYQQLLHRAEARQASLLTKDREYKIQNDTGVNDPTFHGRVDAVYMPAGDDDSFAEQSKVDTENRVNRPHVEELYSIEEVGDAGRYDDTGGDNKDWHIKDNIDQDDDKGNSHEKHEYGGYHLDSGGFPINDTPRKETKKKRLLTHQEFAHFVRTVPPDQRRESLRTYNCSKGGNPYCLTSAIQIIMQPSTSVASCSQGLPVDLVILITSSPGHLQERTKIRQTWAMAHRRSKIGVIQYAFLLGRSDSDTEEMIQIESMVHGDILMGDFNDAYRNLTLKTILGYEWFRRECRSSKFLMKTDDDAYINTEALVRYANTAINTGHVMVGYCEGPRSKKHHSRLNRWYMSDDQYPDSVYPRYCCGCGYIITGHTARDIAKVMRWLPIIPLEDLFTGVAITRLPYTVDIQSRPNMFAVQNKFSDNYKWDSACKLNQDGVVLTRHHFPTKLLLKFYFECGWDYTNDYHRHDS